MKLGVSRIKERQKCEETVFEMNAVGCTLRNHTLSLQSEEEKCNEQGLKITTGTLSKCFRDPHFPRAGLKN